MSSTYLRLLIFLLAILIPACASSSLVFHMMYSAYKLNKQGDNIQPWRLTFLIWNQTIVPRTVLTVASWPAYRFLRRLSPFICLPSVVMPSFIDTIVNFSLILVRLGSSYTFLDTISEPSIVSTDSILFLCNYFCSFLFSFAWFLFVTLFLVYQGRSSDY